MRRAEALASGVPRLGLVAALAEGRLIAPARGVLALPDLNEARMAAARFRARLTCVSAAAEAGVPVLESTRVVHVAVPASARLPEPSGFRRVHYSAACGRSLATMPMALALDHAGRCVDERAHLVMIDAALRKGLITGVDLKRWSATTLARRDWLLRHCDPRAESPQETLARVDLVEAGIVAVPQVWLEGVGRVDLVVEGRLVVEVDGRASHVGEDRMTVDRRRDRSVLRGGLLTVRFTAAEVQRAKAGEIAAVVREVLRAHPSSRRVA